MTTAIALFTRDLRIHDNPVLACAMERAEFTLPLFVLDTGVEQANFAGRHRPAFLADCLSDLNSSLRAHGGRLLVRRGELVHEVVRLAEHLHAAEVHVAADVSGFAARRERRLRAALAQHRCALVVHDAVHTALSPGAVTPSGSDHFAVFTAYWRRWSETPIRRLASSLQRIRVPAAPQGVAVPEPGQGGSRLGGETVGRRRAAAWVEQGLQDYADRHDLLAVEGTSRLSPYLHFGCISAVELVGWARQHRGAGSEAFIRQLAWRDFHAQLLAARPAAAHDDYRARSRPWADDADALAAWRAGQTGYPIVDAGLRQLVAEGWMHNRARLITGSFLTKTLDLDWRAGAAHFFAHLLDGDIANNCLNWQWVAGTGTDTRPYRRLNPLRQAKRFDPDGAYVRRWVPELADLPGEAVHAPWHLSHPQRRAVRYPEPIVAPPR